ncbi:S8 family serine peptidase [Micromonospora sp. NPDC005367]|uniref:S8 family serine peptidase n=1 Tax=Micromonospora sp. NPDC005367 TaxID=3155590 RepID=UPI00339F8D05
MRRRRLPSLLLGTLLVGVAAVAVTATDAPTADAAPAGAPPTAVPAGAATTITLITGDRVITDGRGGTAVERGPGRAGIDFVSQTVDDHQYVIPVDALPLLEDGRLDRRLFDLTALAEFGYDDRSGELPLLVSYPGSGTRNAAAARTASTVAGARVVRDLPSIGALAVRADRAGRAELWQSLTGGTATARTLSTGVDRVWLDGKRTIDLDVSVPQIGAPAAWQAGLDGTGTTVAVLDTGVDATHPDLAGQIVGMQNFTSTPSTDDTVGHGTHVASTIAGTGAASDGRYKGVAPGAKLLIGKICGDRSCTESDVLAGMAWAAPQAQIINMSLGGGDTAGIDPLEQAVNDLTARYGTLFVIAAGNEGATAPVGSPASADAALAVAAVDSNDQLASFSSRGPRVGDHAVKPDIAAPGVNIVAAKAAHGVGGTPAPVTGYTSMSGTSMATPHVAGAAAILTQAYPGWSAQQRKTALMAAAKPTAGMTVFEQGAGRVDVARVISQTVATQEGSVSFGRQPWPHADDAPIVKTVTYRNDGPNSVTLSLSVQTAAGVPADAFTTGATSLTVPAGGTASTTLTVDTAVDGPDGYWTGYLSATAAGGVQVQTPFAVDREREGHDVTLVHTGRDGAPATTRYTSIVNLDTYEVIYEWTTNPTPVLHLPSGRYGMYTWINGPDTDPTRYSSTMLVQPAFVVDRPLTIQLDARLAKPISVTVPRADAVPTLIAINATWSAGPGKGAVALSTPGAFAGNYVGQIGPDEPAPEFKSTIGASFAALTGDAVRNSPYVYDLVWFDQGGMFDGLTKAPKPADLATIESTYAGTGMPGEDGMEANGGRLAPGDTYWTVYVPFELPFRRTEYVNTDGGVGWSSTFMHRAMPAGSTYPATMYQSNQPWQAYLGGRTYRQSWNQAVFGPSSTSPTGPADWVTRTGDVIQAAVPMFADGTGRPGNSMVAATRVALYRGDTLLGSVDKPVGQFTVPAGPATYRLEASATRAEPSTLSTNVSGVWTFRSGHVNGETPQRLPLSTVRLSPPLDELNAAPAGRRFDIPLTVERQPGASIGRTKRMSVEVSYDDGQTWRRAVVTGSGDHRVVKVSHPKAAGFVSLRVQADDVAGNTVTQTVIRAYAIS